MANKKQLTASEMGKLGVAARNRNLTAEQRSAIAKKAVMAREAKRKKQK